ncbi:DUF1285 domain-containing protein [Simiduia sp. 21SJ11W-1]|uniref:DUF1285 domain-containing protein n=1 Tax=Simiduia sp. 21SJ11W-1 TaxID=2909669 RepID=UPI00209C86F8|nr:DUF1285 domain-containing protein [Simiduia sp. 21SJ11W-1]UTA46385.1 DUF1285 domain-containing protein [Simiduia sp. 21SJ11W-1]
MSVKELQSQLAKLQGDDAPEGAKKSATQPPVHLWKPPVSGDIDIRIDREGRWFHEGDEIKRERLVKLFASVLWEEQGEHYLVTPVEKWRIRVDVAPLLVVAAEREGQGASARIELTTSTGDVIALGDDHRLQVHADAQGNPVPLVNVRYSLNALINRNVFYQLAEWAEPAASGDMGIWSNGEFFPLAEGECSA